MIILIIKYLEVFRSIDLLTERIQFNLFYLFNKISFQKYRLHKNDDKRGILLKRSI